MCSGSDVAWSSSGDDGGGKDIPAMKGGRRGRGRGGRGRGGRHDTAAAAAAAKQEGALQRVFAVAREVQAEDVFRHTHRSAVVQEALTRVDHAGARFWGASGLYSRHRTVLDACLRDWPADLGGEK